MMTGRKRLIVLSLAVLLWGTSPVLGQLTTTHPATPTPEAKPEESVYRKTIATLRSLIQSTEAVQEQIERKEVEFQTAETEEQKKMIGAELTELTQRLEKLNKDFEGIATGIEVETFMARPRKIFDWREEIQVVLGPIVEELKQVTSRPREIERLRSEVVFYEKRLPSVKNAVSSIKVLKNAATARKLKNLLADLEKLWVEKEKELSNQLSIAQYHLEEKLKEEKPFVESIQQIILSFFRSRGRNLVLAVLAFFIIFLLLRWMHRVFLKLSPRRVTEKRPYYMRLATVIYQSLTVLLATSAFLLVLYISGDWVLLGIALIFLFGLAWTAKQGLPLFWEQMKILLNLSTVREGERVIYDGLPWQVKSLNLYTKLHNPALKGGLVRLPLRDLTGLQSRPFYKDEPWFPCREGDLVMLADGGIGTILMQTPEQVILDTLGGCHKSYPTQTFLQQNPINYSINNFGVFVTFGLDYAQQSLITRDIPQQLEAILAEELAREEFGKEIITLLVQFKEAAASSLNLLVFTSFPGKWAPSYFAIGRTLQRIVVDACTTHGWNIPFNQVTVHHVGSPPPESGPTAPQEP